MSINYTSVIGVGVPEEDITYQTLTDYSKKIVQNAYIGSLYSEDFYTCDGKRISNEDLLSDGEVLNKWFLGNAHDYDYDIWHVLGLERVTGNYFTGEKGYRGVDVDLNNIQEAKDRFKKVVSLEPEVFNDVLVW